VARLDITISCPYCISQQLPNRRRARVFCVGVRRTGGLARGIVQAANGREPTVPYCPAGVRVGVPVVARWICCLGGREQARRFRLHCSTNRAKGTLAGDARADLRRLRREEGHVLHGGDAAHGRNERAAAAPNQGRRAGAHAGHHRGHPGEGL
jgi:hypothetical protein